MVLLIKQNMMQQLMQQEHTNQNDAAQPVRDEKRC
jgi:hypothetical protein